MKSILYKLFLMLLFALPATLAAQMTDLIISEYAEGSSNNKYIELYNGTGQTIDLSNYVMWKIINGGPWPARTFPLTGMLAHGQTYLMVNPSADPSLLAIADTVGPVDPTFVLFNGNDAMGLAKIVAPGDTVLIDAVGEQGANPPATWAVAGVADATAEHTLIRKPNVCGPNASWSSSAGTNADDSEWIVREQDFWEDAGIHSEECGPPVIYATDLIISEYAEGSSNNKYIELYNGTGQTVDLSNYVMWKILNGGPWYSRSFPLSGMLAHGETYLMVNPSADPSLLAIADTVGPVNPTFVLFNGNDAMGLAKIVAPGDTVLIDAVGEQGDNPPATWMVAGTGETAEFTLIRKPGVCSPNANWSSSAGTNAEDSEWIVQPQDYWEDAGKHTQMCGPPPAFASDLIISEYAEGSSNNKYIELYNGTGQTVDLSNYVMWKILNGGPWYARSFPLEGTLAHGKTYLMVNPSADPALLAIADTVGPVNPTFVLFNGNDAMGLAKIVAPGDTVLIDAVGEQGENPPATWAVAGVEGATAEYTLIRKPNVCSPNASWSSSAGTNAENSEWIVQPQDYWEDAGKHTQQCEAASAETVNVTFLVDMSQQTVSPVGVHLAGSFNGFNPTATPMSDANSDGIWEVTLELLINNTYQYRFVNGNQAGVEENVPNECAAGLNRAVEVAETPIVLDVVCFGSCGVCVGVYNITFRVDMNEVEVSPNGVHIVGNFQNWDPTATSMTDNDGDGIYEYTLELGGNTTYLYKFINGNSFAFAETVPAACARDNNRFLEVGTSGFTTESFCFNSCASCLTATVDVALDRSLRVFPNPNNGQFEVAFSLPEYRDLTINLYNAFGQRLVSQSAAFGAGTHNLPFAVKHKGILLVEIISDQGKVNRRVLVH